MSPIEKLIELDKTSRKKIAIVGDSMVDQYVHGKVEWGQEDCPKFIEESRVSVPGGAANAERSLQNWNVLSAGLFQRGTLPVKTRYVVNGKFMFRHDLEQDEKDTCFEADRETALFYLREHPVDAILISDYAKGFLTPAFIRQVIDLANERGVPVVADAKREPEIYRGAILKCNADYARRCVNSLFELGENGGTYIVTHGLENPVAHGELAFGVPPETLPGVICRNHVGAGDCFAAHLLLALAHQLPIEDAAAVAHSAGRCYVQKEHNEPPAVDAIRADMMGEQT